LPSAANAEQPAPAVGCHGIQMPVQSLKIAITTDEMT
jgi:hypothetical protein